MIAPFFIRLFILFSPVLFSEQERIMVLMSIYYIYLALQRVPCLETCK